MARTTTEEEARKPAEDGDPRPSSDAPPASTPDEPTAESGDEVGDEAEVAERSGGLGAVGAVAVALVVLAAGCAAYFGWSWYAAAHDDSLAYSRAREAVLRAGEQGVQNMNTLDYRHVDQGLTSWEESSTGDLHEQLVQGRSRFGSQVQQAKTVTVAKILDGAVTELDDRAGRAGVMVALQITVTPPKGQATTKQSRMRAELTRTSSGWKLSALGQAPVGTSGNNG